MEDLTIYVAISAILITVFGILLSDKRTRDSNKLTRTELMHRLRAWIKIQNLDMHIISINGNRLPWMDFWLDPSKHPGDMDYAVLRTEVHNIGTIPALDLTGSFMKMNKPITKEMLENFKNPTLPFPLVPGDVFPCTFQISKEEYNNANKIPFYFGLLVRYKVENETKGIGKIWKYNRDISTEYTWLDE